MLDKKRSSTLSSKPGVILLLSSILSTVFFSEHSNTVVLNKVRRVVLKGSCIIIDLQVSCVNLTQKENHITHT